MKGNRNYCSQCINYEFDFQQGVLCGLNNKRPTFQHKCSKLELKPGATEASLVTKDPLPKITRPEFRMPEKKEFNLKESLRSWGLVLLLLGVVHLFANEFLSAPWGIMIILIGIINFVYINKNTILVNSTTLFFVGYNNTIYTLADGGIGGWTVFGLLQIYWGFKEYKKYKELFHEEVDEQKLESDNTSSLESQVSEIIKPHNKLGIFSFITSLATYLIFIISFAAIAILFPEEADANAAIETFAFALTLTIMVLLAFFSLTFGIASVNDRSKKRVFGFIGVIFSSIFILFFSLMNS